MPPPEPRAPLRLVVDASVGIKLFLNEALSDRAASLFDQLQAQPPAQLYVPDLFFIECASILTKHVQRFGYPAASAAQDLSALRQLRLRSVSTAELMATALQLALAQRLSAYDAAYVTLAQRLQIPLITADERLVRATAPQGLPEHWLGSYLGL